MNTFFRKNLIWSVAGHIGILVLVILLMGSAEIKRPSETIRYIDLAPDISVQPPPNPNISSLPTSPSKQPDDHQPSDSNSQPPAHLDPPPVPTTVPTEATPKPTPKEITKPIPTPVKTTTTSKPVKTPKPVVKASSPKSDHKPNVTQPIKSEKPPPAADPFDSSAFAKKLLAKLPSSEGLVTAKGATGSGTSASGQPNDFAWYLNQIFEEMHNAWQPPFGLEDGLTTQVLLRIEKTGFISQVSLESSSGNTPMDESALAAANRVKKLAPPPKELGEPFAEVTIKFKKQKE